MAISHKAFFSGFCIIVLLGLVSRLWWVEAENDELEADLLAAENQLQQVQQQLAAELEALQEVEQQKRIMSQRLTQMRSKLNQHQASDAHEPASATIQQAAEVIHENTATAQQ